MTCINAVLHRLFRNIAKVSSSPAKGGRPQKANADSVSIAKNLARTGLEIFRQLKPWKESETDAKLNEKKEKMKPQHCLQCGFTGQPRYAPKGNILIEIILWSFVLIPGLIYSCWRVSNRTLICPSCRSPQIIPIDSPRARELGIQAPRPSSAARVFRLALGGIIAILIVTAICAFWQ